MVPRWYERHEQRSEDEDEDEVEETARGCPSSLACLMRLKLGTSAEACRETRRAFLSMVGEKARRWEDRGNERGNGYELASGVEIDAAAVL